MRTLAIALALLALIVGGIAFGFSLCLLLFTLPHRPAEKREVDGKSDADQTSALLQYIREHGGPEGGESE